MYISTQTTAEGKAPAATADLEPALFFTAVVLNMTADDVDLRFKARYIKDIRAALPGATKLLDLHGKCALDRARFVLSQHRGVLQAAR